MYKRQVADAFLAAAQRGEDRQPAGMGEQLEDCLLYTSDAADELLCVDLGGRRIIKTKTNPEHLLLHYTPLYY